jgi:localization factor PodJL
VAGILTNLKERLDDQGLPARRPVFGEGEAARIPLRSSRPTRDEAHPDWDERGRGSAAMQARGTTGPAADGYARNRPSTPGAGIAWAEPPGASRRPARPTEGEPVRRRGPKVDAAWIESDALGSLRSEILDLQLSLGGLATRSEILDIERQIRGLAAEIVGTRGLGAAEGINARLNEVQEQVSGLAREIPATLHERIGSAIDLLNWKIDTAKGVDAADLRYLGDELARLRRSLAEIADPKRIEQMAEDLGSLRALAADLRTRLERDDLSGLRADLSSTRGELVAQGDDLAALRTTFEGMRRALVGESGAATASLSTLRHEIGQRLDVLLDRPAPESLAPIATRLGAIESGLAKLKTQPQAELAAMAASFEQVATIRAVEADHLAGRFDRLDEMLRGIRDGIGQAALPTALETSQASLARLAQTVEQVAAKFDLDSLSTLRDSLHAAIRSASTSAADPALLDTIQALDAQMRELAAREPQGLEALQDQLTGIAARLDRLSAAERASSAAPLQAPVGQASPAAEITERLDRIEELLTTRGESRDGFAQGLKRLNRIEKILTEHPVAVDQIAQGLERLDDGLRHVAQVSDTASVEILLRSLGSRLDEIQAPREQVERLEQQIAGLAAALERAGRPDPAVELLHQTIGEAVAEMRALREESAAGGDAGPSRAQPRSGLPVAGLPEVEAIARDLHELKALQAAREDQTQEAFTAIQSALGSIAMHMSQRDAAPPVASAFPPAVATPSPASRPSPVQSKEFSWADSLRNALGRSRADVPRPKRRGRRKSVAEAGAPPAIEAQRHAAAAEHRAEPSMPKAGVPDFRPIVMGSSSRAEPGRIRSTFIAALRRNQAAGETEGPGAARGRTPRGGTLQSVLLLGTTAAALTAGLWFMSASERISDAVSAVTTSAGTWRTAAMPAKPQAVGTATPGMKSAAVERVKLQDAASPSSKDAEAKPAGMAQTETASLSMPQNPPSRAVADELPAGVPARLRPAVLAGNPSALYELAFLLVQGREMTRDPVLGAKMLERAAAAGLAPAQFSLAQLYETGVGVPQDLNQAQAWYRRAAERGNTRAMQNLGVLLAAGIDGRQDYPAALPWFRQAADLGIRDSQYNLAVILAWGIGTPRNLVEAYKWFALVAKGGDQEAAAKRDEIAREMSAADIAAAKAQVENWRPRTIDQTANTVPPVPQGVSDAAAPTPPSGRV